jgi:hypothetical protein
MNHRAFARCLTLANANANAVGQSSQGQWHLAFALLISTAGHQPARQ